MARSDGRSCGARGERFLFEGDGFDEAADLLARGGRFFSTAEMRCAVFLGATFLVGVFLVEVAVFLVAVFLVAVFLVAVFVLFGPVDLSFSRSTSRLAGMLRA